MLGMLIVIAISNQDVLRKYSTKSIKLGLIINTVKYFFRNTGERLRFDNNTCLIIEKNKVFKGSRINAPVTFEILRYNIINLDRYVKFIL